MKFSLFLMPILMAFSMLAHADDLPKCHALKFDSYFVAQNVQDNIKRINSDLTHANFDHHFLLLRAELAMETLYLIASCDTGEFFHEKLNGEFATFTEASNLLTLKDKNQTSTQYEWDAKSWIKGEETKAVTQPPVSLDAPVIEGSPVTGTAPAPSAATHAPRTQGLQAGYEKLFSNYSVKTPNLKCVKPNYSSFFRAQKDKVGIETHNKMDAPNFAGTKLLLRTETLFDPVYLLADCATGKFSDELLKGNLTFHPDSRLVLVKSSEDAPELKIWSDTQWIQIPDPVQKAKDPVTNTLYGEKAKLLWSSLPNPQHLDVVRFENLKRTSSMESLFQELGTDTIVTGNCHKSTSGTPVCEVETQ